MLKLPRLRLVQSSGRKYQRFFLEAYLNPAAFNVSLWALVLPETHTHALQIWRDERLAKVEKPDLRGILYS